MIREMVFSEFSTHIEYRWKALNVTNSDEALNFCIHYYQARYLSIFEYYVINSLFSKWINAFE